MKISLNTIKQFTDIDVPVDELVKKINEQLGGVEEVVDLGTKYKDVVIVRVVECDKHPNADKLSVCLVDDGGVVADVPRDANGLVQVVCGAPNVRAGMVAAWLPPGSTVPASFDDKEPFVLSGRELRGIVSQGMLAAPDELAIGTDHNGILEITEADLSPLSSSSRFAVQRRGSSNQGVADGDVDNWIPNRVGNDGAVAGDDETAAGGDETSGGGLVPGASFAKLFGLDDTIIDIENKMFTHRPDCFGQLGVAREISAILKGLPADSTDVDTRFVNPDWYWQKPSFATGEGLGLTVFNDVPDKSPRFMAVAMKNVEVKPSPLWLQIELVRLGSKSINNVVDITNYMMLLTAQPSHAYDYDKLRGATLGVRMATKGEKATFLNGKSYELAEDDVVIADSEGVIGLAGIIGGGNSEVSLDTKNIVLEVANFDMYTLRKSSMRHGIFTDALTRFSKGQSQLQNDRVLARIMEMMGEYAGANQASNVLDEPDSFGQLEEVSVHGEITISAIFINSRLGLGLELWQIGGLLRRANFASYPAENDKNTLIITAPFWRTDIELPEDIVEEVGRLYGFDKLPRELPLRSIKPAPKNARIEMKRRVRHALARAGANEVLTYSFVHENVLKKAEQDPAQAFKLGNALSPDLQYYRLSVLPSLLDKVHGNIKAGHDEFVLFEFGKAHRKGDNDDEGLPREYERLAAVYAAKKSDKTPYFMARRYVESVAPDVEFVPLAGFDISQYAIFEQLAKPFDPQRSAVLMNGEKFVGVVGEFRLNVRNAFKLPESSAGFELFRSYLLGLQPKPYTPLSRFPSVTQDISLRVVTTVTQAQLFAIARDAFTSIQPAQTTAKLHTIGIYQPDSNEAKTVTLRLRIASYERTLTDAEVSAYLDHIAEATAHSLQAVRV